MRPWFRWGPHRRNQASREPKAWVACRRKASRLSGREGSRASRVRNPWPAERRCQRARTGAWGWSALAAFTNSSFSIWPCASGSNTVRHPRGTVPNRFRIAVRNFSTARSIRWALCRSLRQSTVSSSSSWGSACSATRWPAAISFSRSFSAPRAAVSSISSSVMNPLPSASKYVNSARSGPTKAMLSQAAWNSFGDMRMDPSVSQASNARARLP
mmetsp:Transcript_5870/g.13921  ORF Transcript_5870/g.13921 Transcript_5870/m.13921 type:complete len:214 (-) Transcript_5870:72-713(-)